MYISKFRCGNFKSFDDSGDLAFGPGVNVVTGQNNVGKTSLLEAMSSRFVPKPHRTKTTAVTAASPLPQSSWADISFTLSIPELLDTLASNCGGVWTIPLPELGTSDAMEMGYGRHEMDDFRRLLGRVFSGERTFAVRIERPGANQDDIVRAQQIPSFGLYQPVVSLGNGQRACLQFRVTPQRIYEPVAHVSCNDRDEIGPALAPFVRQRLYRFTAERYNVGKSPTGNALFLAPNASNLPEVLNTLQTNRQRFSRFIRTLNSILPQIEQVTVSVDPNHDFEILVWNVGVPEERIDLAFPLSECGTGVGQVLAILYVVLNSPEPQVILIDEPQSFLHPGAARKLIEFLRGHPEHQVILATHSPAIISAGDPKTVTLITLDRGKSKTTQMPIAETRAMQTVLAETGTRLSDVFGADNVLWVEGRTEERCFPIILARAMGRDVLGTSILGVRRTGDFEGRDAEKTVEIYRQLTQANSILPPAIGFIFDRECRSSSKLADIAGAGGGLAKFITRRMYENYLLQADAIANVMNSIEHFREEPITRNEISGRLEAKRQDATLYCQGVAPPNDDTWLQLVDGARILEQLFLEFSNGLHQYQKVVHAVDITEWLAVNSPGSFDEIAELLTAVFPT